MARGRQPIDLTTTLERVRVPSFVVARTGTVTWLNEAARGAFGELAGKPFTAVVAPEDVPTVEHQLERKLRGVPATDYEIDVFTADGHRKHVEISSVRVENGDHCHAVFGVVLPKRQKAVTAEDAPMLTPRQTEVLRLLADGASTSQIATRLHLSRETVRNHVRHILRALGVHSRVEAVAVAYREGLL